MNQKNVVTLMNNLITFKKENKPFYRWEGEFGFVPTTFSFSRGINAKQAKQLQQLGLPNDYIAAMKLSNGAKFFQSIDQTATYAGSLLTFDEVVSMTEQFKGSKFVTPGTIPIFNIQDIGLVFINIEKSGTHVLNFLLPDNTEIEKTMYGFLDDFLTYSGHVPSVDYM